MGNFFVFPSPSSLLNVYLPLYFFSFGIIVYLLSKAPHRFSLALFPPNGKNSLSPPPRAWMLKKSFFIPAHTQVQKKLLQVGEGGRVGRCEICRRLITKMCCNKADESKKCADCPSKASTNCTIASSVFCRQKKRAGELHKTTVLHLPFELPSKTVQTRQYKLKNRRKCRHHRLRLRLRLRFFCLRLRLLLLLPGGAG